MTLWGSPRSSGIAARAHRRIGQGFVIQSARISALALLVATIVALQGTAAWGEDSPAGDFADFFQLGTLNVAIDEPTAITFGPDGRLYAANQEEIIAITLDDSTHDVVDIEPIASGYAGILGLTFDPTAPPEAPLKLYVSHQDVTGVPGYWGRVSTFTAPAWAEDLVITDLPSSAPLLNHMTNGLAFDTTGVLFIAQGSMTDSGLVGSPIPEYYPESPLSAAMLMADVNDPSFDGTLVYSPSGEPLDHNVDLVSGDVEVFAAGLRNPYDLVFHSNGLLYATDNGPLGQNGATSCDGDVERTSTFDELNLIEEGNYYGAPNLNRGRSDPRQCVYRAPEDGDGDNTTGPISVLPRHCSCDGIIEYQGPALGGDLNGDLIIASFSRGVLLRVELAEDGRSVTDTTDLVDAFDAPLDLALDSSGVIYIADFDDDEINFLVPILETPTPTQPSATTPNTPTSTPVPTNTYTPTPQGVVGDANCNGVTNSIDSALVLQGVAGLIGAVGCPLRADVNGDGQVTSVDAALILQIDAGLL
jgi:glucose/arabinose dehydrogenase